jgi:O-antigen ligase
MANYLDYWVGGQRQPRYAHNCYLQVAAEIGLFGAGIFIAWLWQLFHRLFALTLTSQRSAAILVSGLTAGLLAFVIQAGVDTNFYSLRQAVLFWTLAGLAIGYGSQTFSSADRAAAG